MTRPHPILSAVAVATALLLASTGGAVAAKLITGKDVKDNSLASRDIRNKTLQKRDLAPKTVNQLKGQQGAPGVSDYTVVTASSPNVNDGNFGSADAVCPAGMRALGGGATWVGGGAGASRLSRNGPYRALRNPDGTPNGGSAAPSADLADAWHGEGMNGSGGVRNLRVYVICASVG